MTPVSVRRIQWRFAFLGLSYLGLCYASLLLQSDIQLVVRFFLGLDFKEFYDAAHVYLDGGNPYAVPRFVTPPASLVPNLLLAPFHFETARDLWCLASALMLGAGGILSARAAGHRGPDLFLAVAFLFATFPAQMLLERGNIDALVFVLLAVALAARPPWLSAVAWALASLTKIYPMLLAPFLWTVHGRRWLLAALATVAVVCAAFWRETLAYGPHLAMRATEQLFEPNLSPVGYFGHGFHLYALVYVAFNLWLDRQLLSRDATADVRRFLGGAWIVPMLFFPRDVLAYVGVSLTLTFVALDPLEYRLRRWQRIGIALLEALIMIPTTGLVSVTDEREWYSVPRVALFLYSLALVAFKFRLLHEARAAERRSADGRRGPSANDVGDDDSGDPSARVPRGVSG